MMEPQPMQDLYSKMEQLTEDTKEQIAAMRSTVEGVADEIHEMAKILTVGNGQPPITVRMALVEQKLKGFEDRETSRDGRKWQTVIVFATCVVSLLTAVVPHLIDVWLRH